MLGKDLHLDKGKSADSADSIVVGVEGDIQVDFASNGIVLEEVERELIGKALTASGWNRTRAAQLLGISKETLRYRIEKYCLRSPDQSYLYGEHVSSQSPKSSLVYSSSTKGAEDGTTITTQSFPGV